MKEGGGGEGEGRGKRWRGGGEGNKSPNKYISNNIMI